MAGRFRQVLERVVFAGMKSGKAAEPLYVSNRTAWQWILISLRMAIPGIILAVALIWMFQRRQEPAPPRLDRTPAEVAKSLKLPDLKNVRVQTMRDVEVVEVSIDRTGGLALAGKVRNNTSHVITAAYVVFSVNDAAGSQLGLETARLRDLAPEAETNFRMPIPHATASQALVREIRLEP